MCSQCVICVNSKATMETWPCGHRVVCRKCLVRTIQIAVSRRSLPLRCVVCRARVLRLKRSADVGRDEAGPHSHDDSGPQTTAATGGRSHSLPAKLRRNAPAAVAVRSRSMGPSKTAVGGHRRQARRRSAAASWVDTLADHDPGDDDDHDDDQDHDDDDATATTVTVKYRYVWIARTSGRHAGVVARGRFRGLNPSHRKFDHFDVFSLTKIILTVL